MPDPHRPKAHAALRGAGRARSVVARCLLPAVLAVLAALAGCAGLPAWPTQAGFDLLAALVLAVATLSLGVMGAFALIYIPPWLAFRRAGNWRAGLRRAVLIGVLAYVGAFALALGFDQPFGPVLAILLVGVGLLIA